MYIVLLVIHLNKRYFSINRTMQISLTPTDQQQEIQQLLLNSTSKGKCFFQLYTNQQTKPIATNAFELLPIQPINQIIESLDLMETECSFDDNQVRENLRSCIEYCKEFQRTLWRIDNERNQRNSNKVCLLMCVGINIACLFGLWEVLFVTQASHFVGETGKETPENTGDHFYNTSSLNGTNIGQVSQQTNQGSYYVHMIELIVFFALKLISGFWSLAGCLCTTFCICGCLPHYYKSAKFQFDKKREIKQRIQANRKKILKKDA